MAALSTAQIFRSNGHSSTHELNIKDDPKFLIRVCCQYREPDDPLDQRRKNGGKTERKSLVKQFLLGAASCGKVVKDKMSPKQKGDWKDLTLMSLSFALYVYIAQKLVCAYCLWTSFLNQSW